MVPVQVFSSSWSVTAAPGRHFATRRGSVRNSQTFAAGAWIVNVLVISKAMVGQAADRIDLRAREGDRRRNRGAAQLHHLREDAQRHLFGKSRADVEPGRVVHAAQRLCRNAARKQ